VCKATGAGLCPKGPGSTDPSDTGSGSFTQYVYDDAGHLVGEYDVQGCASAAGAGCAGAVANTGELIAEHVWLDDTPVAVIKPAAMVASHSGQAAGNVAIFAVEPDHLDTPRVIANASHQLIWRWDSTPFGDTAANEAPGGRAAFTYALRFPGQQYDAETQTHYNYFRNYEPKTGRYLESDPIGLLGGFNSFVFLDNSPLLFVDPDGLASVRTYKGCKIFGNPQKTRGANGVRHAAESLRAARAAALAGATEVHLNRQLNSSMGSGGGLRPDMLSKFLGGAVGLCEVCSPKQTSAGELAKMVRMRSAIGNPLGPNRVRR
jgi:RHS repeat-associated protein